MRRNGKDAALAERLPPQSLEAEAGVLGSILLSPTEVMMKLLQHFPGPEVFFDLRHRTIYQTLYVMHDSREPMDMITIQQRLKDQNQLQAIGGLSYLSGLPDTVPSAANLDYYAKIVLEKFHLRKMVQGCTEIVNRCYEAAADHDPGSVLEGLQKDLADLAALKSQKAKWEVKPSLREAVADIDREINSGQSLTGLSTGFHELDRITRGLQGGHLIILAARTSQGKSTLALNIAKHQTLVCKNPVGIYSLEDDKKAVMRRLISAQAGISLSDISGDLFAAKQVSKAVGELSLASLYIDDSRGLDDAHVRAGLREMWYRHGIKLGIVDYLQLLKCRRRCDRRTEEIGEITGDLKTLAGELGIPIILISQLNRETERQGSQIPRLSNLKESGSIEENADVVGLLYTKDTDDDEGFATKANSGLYIAKNKNGPKGIVHLVFDKPTFRFEAAKKIEDGDVPVI